jgi:vacuolar-type H+-ATPase subunit H
VDVQQRLDEIVATVGGARSMPMSASCVVNRAELLAMLEEVREALPGSLAQAQELLGGREQMVAEAQQEAQRIIEGARAERGSLVADTEIARRAQQESDRILAEARREAEEIRVEADDYVDSKLANFEVVLSKTIGSVERGREKLLGGSPGAGYEGGDDDAPERTADPEELRHRADEYVDARLGSVAAVLTKTLEAVGRGRQKLLGHRPVDELGAHLAAQDQAGERAAGHTSDDDYLAGLAEEPAQAAQADPYQPAAAQQDPYGQGAFYDAGQGGGYPQHEPYYGAQPGYEQQPGHGPQYTAQPAAALDETSFFDTGMIDLDQVARYEQQYGGQYGQGDGYAQQYGQGQDQAYQQDQGYAQDPAYQQDQTYSQGYGQPYDPDHYGGGGDGRG